jgi:myo-inositol-1-phosphate synthase
VLDLILLIDLARRAGLSGVQEWLAFYFKSPIYRAGRRPEHDLFAQHRQLMTMLRSLAGEQGDDLAGSDATAGNGADRSAVNQPG